MKKYLYYCSVLESLLTQSSTFQELNLLDVNRGGQNFEVNQVLGVLKNHAADGGAVKPLSTQYAADFESFFKQVLNSVMCFSNLSDLELKKYMARLKGLITFRVDPLNFSKQKLILEVTNTIINAKYNFNLFVISDNNV